MYGLPVKTYQVSCHLDYEGCEKLVEREQPIKNANCFNCRQERARRNTYEQAKKKNWSRK